MTSLNAYKLGKEYYKLGKPNPFPTNSILWDNFNDGWEEENKPKKAFLLWKYNLHNKLCCDCGLTENPIDGLINGYSTLENTQKALEKLPEYATLIEVSPHCWTNRKVSYIIEEIRLNG